MNKKKTGRCLIYFTRRCALSRASGWKEEEGKKKTIAFTIDTTSLKFISQAGIAVAISTTGIYKVGSCFLNSQDGHVVLYTKNKWINAFLLLNRWKCFRYFVKIKTRVTTLLANNNSWKLMKMKKRLGRYKVFHNQRTRSAGDMRRGLNPPRFGP